MRLSEGDPIVCRYVLTEIPDSIDSQGQLDELRVAGWRQGLQGFFYRWIESLKTIEFGPGNVAATGRIDTMYQVLAVLARARGPLPIQALTTLVRTASAGQLTTGTRDLDLLSRWVLRVQDDRSDAEDTAYVLAHPRLNEYLAGELASERSAADRAFAAWCADAPAHCSAVDASPALRGYLVSYAALHLTHSRPNALWGLATRAWKDLSLAQSRSLRLFARDIDLCEQAARTPEPDLPRLIGCRGVETTARVLGPGFVDQTRGNRIDIAERNGLVSVIKSGGSTGGAECARTARVAAGDVIEAVTNTKLIAVTELVIQLRQEIRVVGGSGIEDCADLRTLIANRAEPCVNGVHAGRRNGD